MAKLTYSFHTDDPLEAKEIADRLGISLNLASAGPGTALPSGPGLTPVAAPVAAAYQPPPAAHDAADQATLAQGWNLDTHMKPTMAAVGQKHGAQGPGLIKAVLDKYQPGAKISTLAPKHWPAVHGDLTALLA